MNELQIFNNPEFGEIRTIEIDGEPWLVGKDVAVALGYSDTSDALKRHVQESGSAQWSAPQAFRLEKVETGEHQPGIWREEDF